MDDSDPDISFDKGICNYCREYPEKERIRKIEKTNLPWVYNTIRKEGKGKKYDCLLGLSGGVDSSMCLYNLIENGIRPFAFTVDNGWNTKESDENIMRLVEGMKVPFFRYNIDLEVFGNLQSAFLQSGTANVEIPTDHLLTAASYEMASENNIRTIISGGNMATESIMPKAWGYQPRDLFHVKAIYRIFNEKELTNLPTVSIWQYLYYRFVKKIRIINLLDYYEYNREESKKLLNEKFGWKDYGEKHYESTFTWWFQAYYLYTKFGYDKRKPHYSSMILSKQMTRSEAMERLLERPIYPELGIEQKVLKYPSKTYKDYPNQEWLWNLLSKIYGHLKI